MSKFSERRPDQMAYHKGKVATLIAEGKKPKTHNTTLHYMTERGTACNIKITAGHGVTIYLERATCKECIRLWRNALSSKSQRS